MEQAKAKAPAPVAVLLPSDGVAPLVLSPYCPLSQAARLLLVALDMVRSGRHAVLMPTQEALATDMNVNVRTVQRAIVEAQDAGWLRRARRATADGRQPDVYELLVPKEARAQWKEDAIRRATSAPSSHSLTGAPTRQIVALSFFEDATPNKELLKARTTTETLPLKETDKEKSPSVSPVPSEEESRLTAEQPTISRAEQVREVCDYWKQTMGHPRAVTSPQTNRYRRVERMLRHFTVAQLCRAVDGCKRSPYHQGDNDTRTVYDDVELICRSVEKVETFIRFAEKPPKPRRLERSADTQEDFLAGVVPT